MSAIVVGFLPSDEGWAALDAATAEARLRGGKLVVVHSMVGGSRESGVDYLESAEALVELEAKLEAQEIDYCVHEFVRGNSPAEDLIQAVADHEAIMIVIGIRERSTVGKALFGSNALEVLHDADVPVLCVKPN